MEILKLPPWSVNMYIIVSLMHETIYIPITINEYFHDVCYYVLYFTFILLYFLIGLHIAAGIHLFLFIFLGTVRCSGSAGVFFRHPMARPHGRAKGCLLQGCWVKPWLRYSGTSMSLGCGWGNEVFIFFFCFDYQMMVQQYNIFFVFVTKVSLKLWFRPLLYFIFLVCVVVFCFVLFFV